MKLLNKISTYSLVAASGLALTLSQVPQQANAFTIGLQTSTGATAFSGIANLRGQTFQLNVPGDTGDPATTRPFAILNSITFGFNTLPAAATAFIYEIGTIPNATTLVDGTADNPPAQDFLFASSSSANNSSNPFTGSVTVANTRTFFFTSTIELDVTKTYGVFFSANQANALGINAGYAGGNAFTNNTGTALNSSGRDALFVADATAVPFEFEATGGVAILGGLFLANKFRKRNQAKVEIDEKA